MRVFLWLQIIYIMLKVEHIGIAVKSLANSVPLFEKLLNTECYKTEEVIGEKVNTAFFQKGETKIELLESTAEDGVIAKYIGKKGEGIHHIAFEVADIEAEMKKITGRRIHTAERTTQSKAQIINWFASFIPKTPMGC